MDAYSGYREPVPARSPTERTGWAGRDDGYRERDRGVDRTDTFYRGRSPGMFISLFTSLLYMHKLLRSQRPLRISLLPFTMVTSHYTLSYRHHLPTTILQY